MLASEAVVDAQRPGLEVGEDAMNPGQDIWAAMFPTTCGSCVMPTRRGSRPSRRSWPWRRGRGWRPGRRAGCRRRSPRSAPGGSGRAHPRRPRQRRRPTTCLGGCADRRRSAGHPWSGRRSGFRPLRPGPPAACALVRPWPGAAWWRATMRSCRNPGRAASGVAAPRSRWSRGHQIGGPEPRDQRQLGAVHHRTGRHRGLLATVGAFMGVCLGRERPPPAAAAGRTDEACRPAQDGQVGGAGFFVWKTRWNSNRERGKSVISGHRGS